MAFSLGTMTAYVEENKAELIAKAITGSQIMDLVDVRGGIKNSMAIPILESTAPAQAGAACGYSSSGTTTISQTTITTTSIKVEESLCLKDLEQYFTQKYLAPGTQYTDAAIVADIMNRKMAQIARKLGSAIVQGATTQTNDTWLKQLNGFIALTDAASDEINCTQQASISTSTVRGIFEEMIFQKIPNAILANQPIVICGQDTFRILLQKLWVDNMYHSFPTANDFTGMKLIYPGSNVTVYGIPDMNADNPVETGSLRTTAKNRILAYAKNNFVVGVDSENEDFKTWFSEDNEQFRMRFRLRFGTAIHFTDQVVEYSNS